MQAINSIAIAADDVRCLRVDVGSADNPVYVPLLNELPRARFRALVRAFVAVNDGDESVDGDEVIDAFFAEYLGRDVVDQIGQRQYEALVKLWFEVSQEDAGVTVGESQG